MIYDIIEKRQYVREYDKDAHIPKSLIYGMLEKAWKVTPSKNNFMPYQVHVLGPEHQEYKDLVFLNSLSNEVKADKQEDLNKILEERYSVHLPNYANIRNCSYLLIFTMRLETEPTPFQQMLLDRGHRYEAVDESRLDSLYPVASFEAGLFADIFSAMCLENDIDVSFTGCFHRDVNEWKDLPFVTRKPIMIMTVGKGKVYLKDVKDETDIRPNFNKIVNFVE